MTATDERRLLRAVDGPRDGAWLCDIREAIPAASEVRVLVGLSCLVERGLVAERPGAYGIGTFSLTFAGRQRLHPRRAATASRRLKVAA